MSPPCQPFSATKEALQKDSDDPRSSFDVALLIFLYLYSRWFKTLDEIVNFNGTP